MEGANAELELVVYNFEKDGHKFVVSVIVTLAELEKWRDLGRMVSAVATPITVRLCQRELVPLLRVQNDTRCWDRLPPRPVDFIPDYRMPTRCGPCE